MPSSASSSPGHSVPERLEICALSGLPEFSPGAPLAELLCRAASDCGVPFRDGDVLVVAQKVVSKAEGRLVELARVEPTPFAISLAHTLKKDPRQVEVVLRESRRIVRMDSGARAGSTTSGLIVVETHHGFVCANAGVDSSNVPAGWVSLLPCDPDASAHRLREEIARLAGANVAVLISDTFGRPWREGLTNVAIGVSGFEPAIDYRGQSDPHGNVLAATVIAAADELAAAAELVMGKVSRRPAALIRHFRWTPAPGKATDLIRPREKDLFR
jgi:coenzyme F420-0:L-glutamate ligase/coenzyme F420-1:gamma-L-glutamate ligase